MRPWILWVCVVGLAGCLGGPGPGTVSSTSSTSAASSTSAPPTDPVAVAGAMREEAGVWLVDVQAHNVGGTTLGYAQQYCVGSPWYAQLSGPPGENLTYRDPDANRLGCPGTVGGQFPSGTWLNWTADPSCDTYAVCDNQWDGRLWVQGDAGMEVQQAPAGTYTWRFLFPYFDRPGHPDEGGGAYHNPEGRHTEGLVFTVEVPS